MPPVAIPRATPVTSRWRATTGQISSGPGCNPYCTDFRRASTPRARGRDDARRLTVAAFSTARAPLPQKRLATFDEPAPLQGAVCLRDGHVRAPGGKHATH